MNSRDNNTYRMLTTVQTTFEASKGLKAITDLPALVKAQNDLAAVNTEIATELESVAGPSGVSPARSVKIVLFDDAIGSCAELAAAVHACAVDSEDGELAAQTDFSESDLRNGREPEIVARCAKIVTLATPVVDDLDDYGFTEQDVTAVGKKVEAFAKACPKPRQNVAKRSAANKAVPRLIRRARGILNSRIDKLVLQLKKTAPAFYNEYRTARKLVSQPGSHVDPKAAAKSTSTPEVAKAA